MWEPDLVVVGLFVVLSVVIAPVGPFRVKEKAACLSSIHEHPFGVRVDQSLLGDECSDLLQAVRPAPVRVMVAPQSQQQAGAAPVILRLATSWS